MIPTEPVEAPFIRSVLFLFPLKTKNGGEELPKALMQRSKVPVVVDLGEVILFFRKFSQGF